MAKRRYLGRLFNLPNCIDKYNASNILPEDIERGLDHSGSDIKYRRKFVLITSGFSVKLNTENP